MEATYFNIVPEELIDIILIKLWGTCTIHDFIEALKLDPQRSFYKVCSDMCRYLIDVPTYCKVASKVISWERVYELFMPSTLIMCSSVGLITGVIRKRAYKISKNELFDMVRDCDEIFLLLLYKFDKEKFSKPKLSGVLYNVIVSNGLHNFNMHPLLIKVIDYRKTLVAEILPKLKIIKTRKIGDDVYTWYFDAHNFRLDRIQFDDGHDDILSLYCRSKTTDGINTALSAEDEREAENRGYIFPTLVEF